MFTSNISNLSSVFFVHRQAWSANSQRQRFVRELKYAWDRRSQRWGGWNASLVVGVTLALVIGTVQYVMVLCFFKILCRYWCCNTKLKAQVEGCTWIFIELEENNEREIYIDDCEALQKRDTNTPEGFRDHCIQICRSLLKMLAGRRMVDYYLVFWWWNAWSIAVDFPAGSDHSLGVMKHLWIRNDQNSRWYSAVLKIFLPKMSLFSASHHFYMFASRWNSAFW